MMALEKLQLLIWKNVLLQYRRKWQTLFEIATPIFFCFFLILMRYLVPPKAIPAKTYTSFDVTYFNKTRGNLSSADMVLAYSPINQLTEKVAINAMAELARDSIDPDIFFFISLAISYTPKGYKNAKDMEAALIQPNAMNSILLGIQFDDEIANATSWPDDIKITFRFPAVMRSTTSDHQMQLSWQTNLLFPLFPNSGPREPDDQYGGTSPGYFSELFLFMQHAISKSIVKDKTGKNIDTKIHLQRFPQLESRVDQLLFILQRFVSIAIMLGFVYTFVNTVRAVTTEKELQLKETMAIMGLPSWLHWLAWFIKQFSFLLVTIVIMVILFKIPLSETETGVSYSVFTYTPWSVLLFFLILFVIASLTFSFMISVFFTRANTAASFMALIWFATFAVFMFTQMINETMSAPVKITLCLLSNTAIGYAFQMIIIAEGTMQGLQWANFFEPISYSENFQPAHVAFMLILDSVMYMAIAVYVENIRPGMYGVPLPWYYPFTVSYWWPNRISDTNREKTSDDLEYNDALLSVVHDEEPKGVPIGVNIQNLTKRYKGRGKAVDNLNLRLYENEITVLLGHNGAGKTTTISMLTGMVPPTSGSVTINGYDIVTETEKARRSLGICPQHNVLFPDLTVAEHLIFYSKLKGIPESEINEEIDHFVKLLELDDKRHAAASSLSGGQKRRLSAGCALCGRSRVVLLDEPTSGLDPAARRALWDLLQREKRGRTVLLTTHFMDEADVLADRVAVLAAGRLACLGSPYFLKRHYGLGYKLALVKDAACQVDLVTEFFKTYVPNLKQNSNIGSELTYILPSESVSKFPEMLKKLEEKKESLCISSYGLSVTSLEEVFMKAGIEDNNVEIKETKGDIEMIDMNGDMLKDNEPLHKTQGFHLLKNHIKAMFLKLMYNTLRNKALAAIQIIWPIINIILSMIVSLSWKFLNVLPPLELSLESGFKGTETLVSQGNDLRDGSTEANVMMAYKDYFKRSTYPGLKLLDVGTSNLKNVYLKLIAEDQSRVRYEDLVGATFRNNSITAWFSNYGLHDSAISLSLVENAIIRSLSPNTTLTFVNHPLPYSVEGMVQVMSTGTNTAFMFSFSLGFCIAVISSFLVLFVIKERISGAKLLQRVSGVRPVVMWSTALIWDWIWLFLNHICIIVTIACFQEMGMSTPAELGRILLVLMVFSLAIIPLHYLASFCFEEAATGFSKMVFVNIFCGSMLFLVTEVLRMPFINAAAYAEILEYPFSLLPIYCVSKSVREMVTSSIKIKACDSLCNQLNYKNCTRLTICNELDISMCCIEDNPFLGWKEPGIARYLFTMIVVATVSFAILLAKEYELWNKVLYKKQEETMMLSGTKPKSNESKKVEVNAEVEDDDVVEEKQRVLAMTSSEVTAHSLVCRELSKRYRRLVAVDRLTFAVRGGECFGLLGVNGAGKTSTFRMLTGDARVSDGDALVHGHSVRAHVQDVHRLIGYCPQFDALFDNLTAREILKIFCLLRGIPTSIGETHAIHLAKQLGFIKHYDKKVRECSGGTKRKISTAVALLGDYPVIFLDEPTTGMDPASKRLVWRGISSAVGGGRSVVLTSHSMEECEALCSKLTVMVNGRLCCLGSLQHLKSKFSQGYTIIVKCKSGPNRDAAVLDVHNYMTTNFVGANLIETYLGMSTYHVSSAGLPWWRVFSALELARDSLPLDDYSVAQTTLEQVFLAFTKLQRPIN